MQPAFSGQYQLTTLGLIEDTLEKRFQKSSIELVFLSIIHSTLANLDGVNIVLRSEALTKASSWIAETTRLPPCLSMSITGSISQANDQMPMMEVLDHNLKGIEQPKSPLLQYPVGGFVVLMLVIKDMNQVKLIKSCQLAVWHRFLFHLVERHCQLVALNQSKAILALQNILAVSSANTNVDNRNDHHLRPITELPGDPRDQTKLQDEPRNVLIDSSIPGESNVPSICLSTVCQTHLLAEEDLDEFRRLENLFEPVRDLCSAALHGFLKCLSEQAFGPSPAIDIFDTMRAQEDLHEVLVIPQI